MTKIERTLAQVQENIEEIITQGELNSENKIQIRIMLEAIVRTTLEIQGDKVRVALQNAREIINQ